MNANLSESKSDSLYELIKSLSKSEKAYFKKFSSIYSSEKNKNYLKLFDLMDKMENYNSKNFQKKIIENSLEKNLPSNKNYLYSLILRAMDTLYSHENAENEIMELIKNYRFLSRKKLNVQALRMLNRAKSLAKENEMIPEQFLIINDERIKYANENKNTLQAQLTSVHEELESLLKILHKECKMGIIYFDTYQLMSADGVARNNEILDKLIIKLGEAKKLKQFDSRETFVFNLRYFTFFESYYFLIHNFEEAAKCSEEIINLYERYPNKKVSLIKNYISGINNFLNALMRIPDFKKAKAAIEKLENILDHHQEIQFFINERLYHFKLLYHLKQGSYTEAQDTVDELIEWIQLNEGKLNKAKLLILYYDLSQYYLGIKNIKKGLYYNNKILNEFTDIIYNDFLTESRILHLLIHYEMKDFEYLDYKVTALYRQLPKDKNILKTERLTVQYLKKLIASDKKKEPELFKAFYKRILDMLNDPFEKFLIEETRINYWLKGKIEKKQISDNFTYQV